LGEAEAAPGGGVDGAFGRGGRRPGVLGIGMTGRTVTAAAAARAAASCAPAAIRPSAASAADNSGPSAAAGAALELVEASFVGARAFAEAGATGRVAVGYATAPPPSSRCVGGATAGGSGGEGEALGADSAGLAANAAVDGLSVDALPEDAAPPFRREGGALGGVEGRLFLSAPRAELGTPELDDGGRDSERRRRLLSQTGVKNPDRRSTSPTLKLLDGLEDSVSRSSVLMLVPRTRLM
jgi:hypothetical protein